MAVKESNKYRNYFPDRRDRVVFTNGVFDTMHPGHFRILEYCKCYDTNVKKNYVVVAINSDASVKKLKGNSRPIYSAETRRYMLESLVFVDCVIEFDNLSVMEVLEEIKPDVLVKGATTWKIEGKDYVESYGGEVVHYKEAWKLDDIPISTTRIIDENLVA